MMHEHVKEDVLQDFAMHKTQLPAPVKKHIVECPRCMAVVQQYRTLFSILPALEKPAPDFDLARLVLPNLPARSSFKDTGLIFLGVLTTIMFLAGSYFLLPVAIKRFFSLKDEYLLVGIIAASILILAFLWLEQFRSFKRKLNIINNFC